MARVEVLVATMHQTDFSLIEKMNLNCDAVIANQTDHNGFSAAENTEHRIRMISTKTRGVGINRNLALTLSEGDILVFADDDVCYDSDMSERVLQAFSELPKADAIIFGIHFRKNGKIYASRRVKTKRLSFFRSLRYGTAVLAIRKKSAQKASLSFSELYGGGCDFAHGEDTRFIIDCFKNHLKVYTYDYMLCTTDKDTSTCFTGFHERYYYDNGVLAVNSLGILAFPFLIRAALRKEGDFSCLKKWKYLFAGYRNGKKYITYDVWSKAQEKEQ